MPRSSFSSTQAAGEVNPARFPEAQFLILSARTSLSDVISRRVREVAQAGLKWPLLLDLARYHGVGPLLYRTISTVCPDLIPKESLNALRQVTQAGTLLNRVLAVELIQLCQAFDESGVPVVPFKGATLATMAYEDLNLRDFDDLDFIVPQHRLADAQRVLCSQGYLRRGRSHDEPDAAHADELYHVFVKKNSLVRVDLQWVMAHKQFAFRLDRPEILGRLVPVSIDGHQVKGLAPEDLLIILCVHGSKHAWERLKWVADVAELLRSRPDLDWNQIFLYASNWRCRRMLYMGLSLAYLVLDTPLPKAVRTRLEKDSDVQALSCRMPASLLANRQEGIDEEQAGALYFSLKDSWWERWLFGLLLCRAHSQLATNPPSWFRWRYSLPCLASVMIPAHRAMQRLLSPTIRGAINRWVPHGVK
jgi:hypothetical protein